MVDNKHLDAALELAKLIQEQLPARKRNNNEPSRRSQPHTLFPAPAPENAAVKRRRGRPPLARARPIGAVLSGPTDGGGPCQEVVCGRFCKIR